MMKSVNSATRKRLVASLFLLGASMIAAAQASALELSKVVKFDIPAQPLATALIRFAQQTDIQVVTSGQKVEGIASAGVAGEVAVSDALARILEGTGFSYRVVGDGTITIVGNSVATAHVQLSQLDARDADAVASGGGAGETQSVLLEEVVVTGTHIRGAENDTVPITVLDRAYIDSTGIGTTTALIESLPQNFALSSPSGVVVPGVSGPEAQGSSINLRAIGEGTTLTLINGRRMAPGFFGRAADISALPLSAIDRVEVLTDGASALYGSDAVGGVVNFILRRDFKGAETRLRSGWADGGINEYRVSQALGNTWGSGNALISLEYYKRDLLRASERDFVPDASIIGSLYPQDKNVSAMFTGRQSLSDSVSLFADALYTKRDSYNEGGRITLSKNNTTKNPQLMATLGLDWRVGGDWQIEGAASYARNKLDLTGESTENSVVMSSLYDSRFAMEAAGLKADGSVFDLPGGSVRLAVGADWRSEYYRFINTAPPGFEGDFDRTVRSAFAELYVPLIGEANAMRGVNRLQLSVAGRYDDYSTFGSSFDPKIGLMWEPVGGLRLRGSYGTSYVAPNLIDYDFSNNGAFAFFFPDSRAASGVSYLLFMDGSSTDGFSAQESESSSFGLEFTPGAMPGLQLGLNYYRIDYTDRIAYPPSFPVVLENPASFSSLIIRDPTVEQVNTAVASGQAGAGFFAFDADFMEIPDEDFVPSTVDVIVDTRRRNLSVTKTSGLDLSTQYDFDAAGARMHLGLTGTYIFELEQQVTSASDPFDSVDTFNNPPDWRVRGSFGWQRQGWAANFFVNHMDSYTDNRTAVPVPIASYTTVDARLAYDFKARIDSGFLSGVTLSANAQNLFDKDPPRAAVVSDFSDMGFDPTNASPMGRFIAVEAVKVW